MLFRSLGLLRYNEDMTLQRNSDVAVMFPSWGRLARTVFTIRHSKLDLALLSDAAVHPMARHTGARRISGLTTPRFMSQIFLTTTQGSHFICCERPTSASTIVAAHSNL